MKQTFKGKHIFIAVFLIAILLLCIPANIISEKSSAEDKNLSVQSQNVSTQINTETTQENVISHNTIGSLEEYIPAADVQNVDTAKNGEVYVPATLNNVMLDNLSSMVTKRFASSRLPLGNKLPLAIVFIPFTLSRRKALSL